MTISTTPETMTNIQLSRFIAFAKERHDVFCNQKYAVHLPYSFHLKWVAAQGNRFKHLLPQDKRNIAIAGCWGHDIIEDARLTYNDISIAFGQELADIIYSCTEEKGKNRSERHSAEFYIALSRNEIGIFVKLCDIIANVTFSMLEGSKMLDRYKSEYEGMKDYLYMEKFKPMFDYLVYLLKS